MTLMSLSVTGITTIAGITAIASIADIAGGSLIAAGMIFVAIGMFGILKYNDLFTRLLIAAKVDTVGFITIMIGAMIRSGLDTQTLKILLILAFVAITNPLVTHSIGNSAFTKGLRPKRKDKPDD